MKLPSIKTEEAQPAGAAAPRKTFWTIVLHSTPVILTVVATVLAGLSSSEMTQAQYHRALAAQNQSKASDQWNFFQFKRSRGMTAQLTIDFLHALAHRGKIAATAWQAAAEQLVADCRRAEKEAAALLEKIRQAKSQLGAVGDKVLRSADDLVKVLGLATKEAEAVRVSIQQQLAQEDSTVAFAFLNTKDIPTAKTGTLADPRIADALKAIEARRTERETAPLIGSIPEPTLHEAIEVLEGNVLAVENANKPVSDTLNKLDSLMQRQVDLADDCYQAVRSVSQNLAGIPVQEEKSVVELQRTVDGMRGRTAEAKKAMQDVSNEFKVAQFGYTVRRYEAEARHNQKAAALYEVQIRRSSVESEKRRNLSKQFFYGMLAAQAGVTIATFSLAVKYKSLLWSLASVAGIGAVVFSGWVYLSK